MRTQKQIEASRRNGARSKGPATPEGKSRSSRNATRHGLDGGAIVLSNEDVHAYRRLLDDYILEWQPATRGEHDLVRDLVNARWRLDRVLTFETSALDLEMDRQRDSIHLEIASTDEATLATIAFSTLADSGRTLPMLSRHEGRLRRIIDRSTERLTAVRKLKSAETNPGIAALAPGD
jgi:hypothetical protein